MAGVRLLSGHVRGTFLECDTREVEERKLTKLIMKGQGGGFSPDVSDGNSWSSVDDWDHNAWNPTLDFLAEYRTGQTLLELHLCLSHLIQFLLEC